MQDQASTDIMCSPASADFRRDDDQVQTLQTARQQLQAALDDDDEART